MDTESRTAAAAALRRLGHALVGHDAERELLALDVQDGAVVPHYEERKVFATAAARARDDLLATAEAVLMVVDRI